ncbi:hypothetical protein JZ751_020027 [Albula glossodonta]|uniref:Uncharacterized protein n=1 Tax=Albula glossodonta TaxID=121402 RepID=A0A8T2NKC1_9TELE|nr:hypothetical protein JZ751_020027 [Albula glossodonta]
MVSSCFIISHPAAFLCIGAYCHVFFSRAGQSQTKVTSANRGSWGDPSGRKLFADATLDAQQSQSWEQLRCIYRGPSRIKRVMFPLFSLALRVCLLAIVLKAYYDSLSDFVGLIRTI